MTNPSAGPLRLARAGLVAAAVLGLAIGAHLLGGGELPGSTAILALGVLVLATTTAIAGRRFTVGRSILVVGGGQLVLHGLLTALAPIGCLPGGPSPHGAHGMSPAGLVCPPGAATAAHAHATSASMLVGHALATLATVLLIASGERTLWWLLAWLAPRGPVTARPDMRAVDEQPAIPPSLAPLRRRAGFLRTSPRRGPPPALARAAAFA